MSEEEKTDSWGPRITFSRTAEDGSVKSIDLPAPSSIIMEQCENLTPEDLQTEKDVGDLMFDMFSSPEIKIYYFSEYGQGFNHVLDVVIKQEEILISNSENHYYKRPGENRSFLLIHPNDPEKKILPEWKKAIIEAGPSYTRHTLCLSERKKREYETWQKIELEEQFRELRRKAASSYDVFLSYASEDREEAEGLYKAIVAAGGKVFQAEKCLSPGDNFAERIRQALNGSRELWLIISPKSIKSEWVISEWGAAWALDKKIVPILYRCAPESLPDRLRQLQCIDYHKCPDLIKSTFPRKEKDSQR